MAKKNTAVVKVEPGPIAPGWMVGDKLAGIEELQQYIIPPRLKVIQKVSSAELLEIFNPGDIIISPNNVMIAEMGVEKGKSTGKTSGFDFTPVFFFCEWCEWNPILLKGQVPAIRNRTFDSTSIIAMNAKNPDRRFLPHPEYSEMKLRYVEHLNFMILLHGIDQPVILSFSRAAHAAGRAFCGLIRMRNAPLFGCVFHGTTVIKKNQQGDWWEFAVTNPSKDTPQWAEKDTYDSLKITHENLKKAHQAARLRPEYHDHDDSVEPQESEEM